VVELFAPGAAQPTASREVEGPGLLAIVEHEVKSGAGLWTARITNCNSHPIQVTLEATYPGIGDLQPRTVPAHYLEAIASRLLAETSVRLQHGRNASAICFSPALGVREFRFTIPALDRRVTPPLLPDIHIVEQVTDIRSNFVRIRLLPGSVANPGGTLRMEIGFEEEGPEIIGSFPVLMRRMKLLIELDLGIAENRISYNNVRSTFDCDVDIQPLPVWMYNPMFDFRDRLQEAVCEGARSGFADIDTCEAIAGAFVVALEAVLGTGARIATVQMENGQVYFGLFRAQNTAVA